MRRNKEDKVSLQSLTIGELLRRTARQYPDASALEYEKSVWNYRQMDACVDGFARSLLSCGVKKGDHIGLLCESTPQLVFLYYAIVRIGAVAVLMNTSLRREEITVLLEKADVSLLLIGDGYKEICYPEEVRGLERELSYLRGIWFIGNGKTEEYPVLQAIMDADAEDIVTKAEQKVRPEDTATILFTSGTTGVPKAVCSSHFSRANSGIQQAADLSVTRYDRVCAAMPIFHCFSLSVNVMAACAAGACLYLPESRRTTALLRAVSEGGCTVLSCVPTLFRAILARPDLEQWDVSNLRIGFIGGSSYPPSLFCLIEQTLGFTLLSSLGQTEATAGITAVHPSDSLAIRTHTVGPFMAHVQGKIVDPLTGKELPCGEVGEVCVKGYVVMQGYYRDPIATAEVIDQDGWLHTGDMGFLDEAGYLHLTGRLKDIIIRGGENISPAELEILIQERDEVDLCKVVGVPDEHYGEEVCLCVVPKQGQTCDPMLLQDFLRQHVAAYKVPRYVLVMENLPQTASGKVRAEELRVLAIQRLNLA